MTATMVARVLTPSNTPQRLTTLLLISSRELQDLKMVVIKQELVLTFLKVLKI